MVSIVFFGGAGRCAFSGATLTVSAGLAGEAGDLGALPPKRLSLARCERTAE